MNLKSYSLAILILFVLSASGRPFYTIKDELHLADSKVNLEPIKEESPFNWKFVKRNDLFEILEGTMCF